MGAGEKSLHKRELVGQSTHKKSKLNKTKKTKGSKLEGSRREKYCTSPMLVRKKHAKQEITE